MWKLWDIPYFSYFCHFISQVISDFVLQNWLWQWPVGGMHWFRQVSAIELSKLIQRCTIILKAKNNNNFI